MSASRSSTPQHIVVTGAGVVGIACAYALVRRGHKVTLIDRDEPASGCSYGNAGMTWCPWVAPLARPGMLKRMPQLLFNPRSPLRIRRRGLVSTSNWMRRALRESRPERVATISAALASLAHAADAAHRDFSAAAQCENLLKRNGWLEVYADRSAWERDADERALQDAAGIAPEFIEGAALRERAPALSEQFQAASYHPDVVHTINPRALALAWFDAFRELGGSFVKEQVHDIVYDPHGHPIVINEGAPLRADHAVIALGAWSNSLVSRIDHRVPLAAERGYHAMVPAPGISLSQPVVFKAAGFVATPMSGGLRLAGTDEFAALDAPPNLAVPKRLMKLASQYLPGLDTRDADLWMGARPALPDSLPVISRSMSNDRVVYAFGHHHLCLMLGPLTGQLVSDVVDKRSSSIDLTPFRVQRLWSL